MAIDWATLQSRISQTDADYARAMAAGDTAGAQAAVAQRESDVASYREWTPSQAPAVDPSVALENERKRVARQNALATVRGALEQFGLTSMLDLITQYVQQDYDAESIMVLLRQSPQYKERFPAMDALAKKGRALSEAEYIAFERNASQLERAYGLPSGMLGKDAVTRLLTNEVSAQELENRVTMAAAGAFQTSPEVKQQFRNYYGIDSGGLTAYFLDPERAMPLLQKQYVSAQIGAEAAMQSIDLGVSMAEELQVAGINQQQAREGFGRVAGQRELSMGRGDIVSQQELIGANLKGDTAAQQAIERAGAARVGRFAGGGQYLQTQQGTIGLGTAATR